MAKTRNTKRRDLTTERLREILHYDPSTGIFTRLVRTAKRTQVGDIVGCLSKTSGYLYVTIEYHSYGLHQLAFLYMTGKWLEPGLEPEHSNTNKTDNRWNNLRPATRSQNKGNTCAHVDGTLGFKGVTWDKSRSKWLAAVSVQGKRKYLGRFDAPEDAHAAYAIAAEECFGQFARSA